VSDPALQRGRTRLDHERVGRLLQEDGQRVLRRIPGRKDVWKKMDRVSKTVQAPGPMFFVLFWVSDPLCLPSPAAIHFFQLFFLGPPPC
jgi:hypothetical protein